MRKFLVVLIAALLVPSFALAKGKPADPGSQSKAAPKVMYVLKGTLTAYTAANGTTNGSVTITVKSSNRHGASLRNQSLTFAVAASTKVVGTFTANDNGIVKLRGAKAGLGDPSTFAALVVKQVIDQGAPSSS